MRDWFDRITWTYVPPLLLSRVSLRHIPCSFDQYSGITLSPLLAWPRFRASCLYLSRLWQSTLVIRLADSPIDAKWSGREIQWPTITRPSRQHCTRRNRHSRFATPRRHRSGKWQAEDSEKWILLKSQESVGNSTRVSHDKDRCWLVMIPDMLHCGHWGLMNPCLRHNGSWRWITAMIRFSHPNRIYLIRCSRETLRR